MADLTIEYAPWPVGTTVRLYQRKSELKMDDQPPPLVDNPTSAIVAIDGSLTIDVPDGEWWAIGPDAQGVSRYVALVGEAA